MFLNEAIPYGYGDISVQTPYFNQFVPPYVAPWQKYLPQNYGYTPYQQFQPQQFQPQQFQPQQFPMQQFPLHQFPMQQFPLHTPYMHGAAFTPWIPPYALNNLFNLQRPFTY